MSFRGSHFRRLRNLIMGMASIKKAKNPIMSKSIVIKRDNSVRARLLEGDKTARKPVSSSIVKVMAQLVCHRSVLGLHNILDWYGRYIYTCTCIQKIDPS